MLHLAPKDHITSPAQGQMLYCIQTSPSASLLSAKPSALTQTNVTAFSSAVCKVRSQHSHLSSRGGGTGDAQEKPPAPAVIYLPPQNQLSPAANHHKTISIHVQTPTLKRNPVSLAHPSQRDVSVRAGMNCWLDLPLYLPSLQSQHNQLQSQFQPAPIKLEQISSANSDRR